MRSLVKTISSTVIIFLMLILVILQPIYADVDNEIDIFTRLNKGLEWFNDHKINSTQGIYYTVDEQNLIDVAENTAVSYMLAIHTRIMPTRNDIPDINGVITFTLNAQTINGSFNQYYDTISHQWIPQSKLHSTNAEILQNIAFTAFNLRLESQILEENDIVLLDEAIKSLKNLFEGEYRILQTEEGAWQLIYDDTLEERLKENGEILTALLCIAAYEKNWGDHIESMKYTEYAHKTISWISKMQENDSSHWGYGGFYETEERSIQYTSSNAIIVFSLTTYLRLISILNENPQPTTHQVREMITLWESEYITPIVDKYSGTYHSRSNGGIIQYPKETISTAMCLRAMAETWVVHGDSKFSSWCEPLYTWVIGNNEAGINLQQEEGYFIDGFNNPQILKNETNIRVNAYTIASFIYTKWINIPEIPHYSFIPYMILSLLLLYSLGNLRRKFLKRVQTDR